MDLELLSSRPAVSAVPVTAETPPLSERLLTRRILILGSGPMAAKVVEEIEAVVQKAAKTGAAILAVPIVDTVKQVEKDVVDATLARDFVNK